MPSGRTHDRITLWGLPFVTGITFGLTQSSHITLIVSGAFLFSGLMFGPDLDLHSRPYTRWGPLRWIWIPYQKILRHRSFLSHGPIIGTTLRVLYISSWLAILGIFALGIAQLVWDVGWNWQTLASAKRLTHEWIALYVGLELGAMSHSISDWGSSAYKRFKKQTRAKIKKQSTSRVTRRKPTAVKSRRKS